MSLPPPVAQLRVFDINADCDGMERHWVAESLQGACSLQPGVYQLYTEAQVQAMLTDAYAEGRADQAEADSQSNEE